MVATTKQANGKTESAEKLRRIIYDLNQADLDLMEQYSFQYCNFVQVKHLPAIVSAMHKNAVSLLSELDNRPGLIDDMKTISNCDAQLIDELHDAINAVDDMEINIESMADSVQIVVPHDYIKKLLKMVWKIDKFDKSLIFSFDDIYGALIREMRKNKARPTSANILTISSPINSPKYWKRLKSLFDYYNDELPDKSKEVWSKDKYIDGDYISGFQYMN